MSSLSSSASSASPTPATASAALSPADPLNTGRGSRATLEELGTSGVGPGVDSKDERRRASLIAPDRKRRLVIPAEDVWPRRSRSGTVIEPGSSSRAEVHNRSFSMLPMGPGLPTTGSSSANPIDLSSSPPESVLHQPSDHQGSGSPQGNDGMEYILPRWQPDSEVTHCPICGVLFSFWHRKHHCRKCGRVVCASCSPHRITIPRQYIVRPPEQQRPTKSTFIPPGVAQVVDLTRDDTSPSPAAFNPALGGGEEVRLCNPCVPDPNPDPPRGYTAVRASGDTSGPVVYQPNQPLHRSYHSVSSPIGRPYGAAPEGPSMRPGRRTVGSNDFPSYGGFGDAFGTGSHERPMRFRTASASQHSSLPASASARAFFSQPSSHRVDQGVSFSPTRSWLARSGADPESPRRVSRLHRRRVDERDMCPVCNLPLPPLGEDSNEEAREAHIRDCIEGHGSRARSSSRGGSPASQPPPSLRMLAFTATEKDCIGQDGAVPECTICMEEYEVGQALVRLECLCKFHKRCIVEWFERKKECPVHKVS